MISEVYFLASQEIKSLINFLGNNLPFYRRGLIFARGGSFFPEAKPKGKTVTESKYKTSKVKNALFTGIYVVLFTDIAN